MCNHTKINQSSMENLASMNVFFFEKSITLLRK